MFLRKASFLILFISFLTLHSEYSFAEINQQIQLKQSEQMLQFHIRLENLEKQNVTFLLSSLAQDLTLSADCSLSQKNLFEIKISAGSTCLLDYDIPIDPKVNYYITSEDLWTPALHDGQNIHEQKYSISAELLPEYVLIDSAIGYAQEDFAFVLCKCRKYSNQDQRLKIYLLNDEPALANTLLQQLEIYLKKFETEYGPYPYSQFSVVESEKEVGFAFPKMTWIGNQLLHFPFILKTSLPHELLHSWWGNGVFVDYEKGNWCEGMTSLGADYDLLNDADKKLYRLKALTSYLDYAQNSQEIPLSKFISRGEDRSLQAIGYDKALMVFLMLEHKVGEKTFKLAQKEFFGKFKYQKASYEDFFQILSQISGLDLTSFQNFWLYSTGILPEDFVKFEWRPQTKTLVANSIPTELAKIANLEIETQIQFQNQSKQNLNLQILADGQNLQTTEWSFAETPLSYTFDPDFYFFRKLNAHEKPTTFSQLFGAEKILTSLTDSSLQSALKTLFPNSQIESVSTFQFDLPQTYFVNLDQAGLAPEITAALHARNIEIQSDSFLFSGRKYLFQDHSLFLSLRIQNATVILIRLGQGLTIQRWLQRWTHYGAKGYLILNPTAADEQGLWLEPYARPL